MTSEESSEKKKGSRESNLEILGVMAGKIICGGKIGKTAVSGPQVKNPILEVLERGKS